MYETIISTVGIIWLLFIIGVPTSVADPEDFFPDPDPQHWSLQSTKYEKLP